MEISEIRVFLKEGRDKKLNAYATVTLDGVFVVRNIKVIQGAHGLFIAMPSRKIKVACSHCQFKNEAGSRFCNQCGGMLCSGQQSAELARDAKAEHRDIAHPITQDFREYLQNKILDAFYQETPKIPS